MVVVGGGNAALCAAITAARAGASVIVLEGAPQFYRGGNTRHTRNLRLAHDGSAPTMTGPYAQEEFLDDLYRVTGGETDKVLAELTIARSNELLPWLNEQGVRFQPPLGGTLSLGKTNAFFLGGGRGALNALYRKAEALGVTCLYDTPVTGLTIDNGHFMSAAVRHEGRGQSVRGRALVAAAGGFEANIEWLKEYWGRAADNFLIRGTPYNRGEVLRLLLDSGVEAVGDPTQCHAVAIDARAPKFDGGIATRLDSVVFGIVVNREAQRFYDEGEDTWPKRYAIWGRLIAQQAEQIAYSIVDAKSIRLFMPSIFPAVEAREHCGTGDQAHARSGGAGKDRQRFQRRGAARQFRPHGAGRLQDGRARHPQEPLGAAARYAALLRLSAQARHHLHLPRGAGERGGAHRAVGRAAVRQYVRRRRDHGRQRAGQGLSRRHRHDHRRGVRPHRRAGGGRACPQLSKRPRRRRRSPHWSRCARPSG